MRTSNISKWIKIALMIIVIFGVVCGLFVTAANIIMIEKTKDNIISIEDASKLEDIDCIIVLGCQVKDDGTPSSMLYDRIAVGSELYSMGVSSVILMSGDHATEEYNEPGAMRETAVELGADDGDILEDGYGLCTYDSMFRLAKLYGYKRVVVVTQEYHLYRAMYIADSFGIEAYGVSADLRSYGGQTFRDVREVLARTKDFVMCIIKE